MKSKIIPTLLIAALSLGSVGSFAMAATTEMAVGRVQSIDKGDNTITLTDGATYKLAFGMNAGFYTTGQNLQIVSYVIGTTNIVTQVSFAS